MTEQFEQFIKERQFISNVSPRTVEWYRQSLAWLDSPEPTAKFALYNAQTVSQLVSALARLIERQKLKPPALTA